jgi:hypothetical protein
MLNRLRADAARVFSTPPTAANAGEADIAASHVAVRLPIENRSIPIVLSLQAKTHAHKARSHLIA